MHLKRFRLNQCTGWLAASVLLLTVSSCQKNEAGSSLAGKASPDKARGLELKRLKDYRVRYLAANTGAYGDGVQVISTMINAWGLTWSPTGIAWISANGGHVSDITDSVGHRNPGLDPVSIASPTAQTGGSPTGTVFNPNAGDFVIPSGNTTPPTGARFLFVGDDGVVSAWNPSWGHNTFRVAANSGASYTGLTLATFNGDNFLYAANFATGHIDVWSKTWAPVNWMSFTDPQLPDGYSPFNIQALAGQLYVMYAKVGSDGDEEHGAGLGLVDVYSTNGTFIRRLATGGTLNAPWGVAIAPVEFYKDDADSDAGPAVLVGNFGDGRINAYRAMNGKFLGQLSMHNTPITIDGLWSISFPPSTSTINHDLLYFTAGPNDETSGLFGYLWKAADDSND